MSGDHCQTCGQKLPEITPRYPQQAPCGVCGRMVLITESRTQSGVPVLLDPVPDGDGPHFDTILNGDLSRVTGSGDAIAMDCKGRFPLYRAHYFSCPHREGW